MANPALSAQNTHDLRELARRRLPRIVFDFIDRGTEEEYTLRRNRDVFERIVFRPRTLVDVSGRSQKTTLFGKEYAMPVGIAPTGIAGIACFEADIALARAAAAQGVPFILSTASTIAMERVMREGGAGTRWFQLYMGSDRDEARKLVERARDAGYEALALTTDVPVQASREYNVRNGFSVPFKLRGRNLIDGLAHPRWLAGVFLRTLMTSGVPRLENLDTQNEHVSIITPIEDFRARRDALAWDTVRWLRDIWPRKLLVKGVLHVEDAVSALQSGADGIMVSNHGGRQLDGAPSPVEVLPEIVAEVGAKLTVICDSGFRRGADVVKALALGARAVFVGRPTLFGAAVGGEAGARHALGLIRSEIDRALAMLGCPSVTELGADHVWCPELIRAQRGEHAPAGSVEPRKAVRGL